jgi:cell wall-associated NlpC family hydrolase
VVVAVLAASVTSAALVADAGAAPVRRAARPDPVAALAGGWQTAREQVALGALGYGLARLDLARREVAAGAVDHARQLVRAARRMDPGAQVPGQAALLALADAVDAAHDRAAALVRDRGQALFAATAHAAQIEDMLAAQVARRGHVHAAALRAEWDAAPSRSIDVLLFALEQVGKPYVFAAAGPDAYDCSGLTMAAWAHGGVRLAHFAATQYAQTTRIPARAVAPADLVFFHPDLGHVGLVVGQHLMVHAPQTGDVVRIASIDRGDVRTGRVRG